MFVGAFGGTSIPSSSGDHRLALGGFGFHQLLSSSRLVPRDCGAFWRGSGGPAVYQDPGPAGVAFQNSLEENKSRGFVAGGRCPTAPPSVSGGPNSSRALLPSRPCGRMGPWSLLEDRSGFLQAVLAWPQCLALLIKSCLE